MGRRTIFSDVDTLTLAQLKDMTWRTLNKVLKEMTYGRKLELMKQCEDAINGACVTATAPGNNFSPARGPSTEEGPTITVAKYSYLYTCLSGWMTKEDLEAREIENLTPTEAIRRSKLERRKKLLAQLDRQS